MAALAFVIVALSFVDGWISQDRELVGEGYRHVETDLNAWRLAGVPVLSIGALAALATAVAALVASRLRTLPSWVVLATSVICLAAIGASLVPIGQDGHASSVTLSPGWVGGVGAALAVALVVGAASVALPSRRVIVTLCVVGGVLLLGGVGGRWLGLQAAAGTGQHWSDGSYTRPATEAHETETLTIGSGRFEIGERWAGAWESSGWTVVLTDDPACLDARGTYHAHSDGEEGVDLRFVKVVDPCAEGERAADLEDGVWARDP